MDPIQKVIEKVQQNKWNDTGRLVESKINYTQTKKYEVDNKILRERRVVTLQKHDPMCDVFRMLRTKVLKQMRNNGWNSFAVTAPTPGAGKSLIAVNLAIAMAMEVNQTVLLVDMDLRYPKVQWYFDLSVDYGLRDYIDSDIPLSKVLINPGVQRLVVIPGRGSVVSSSEMLSSPKMRSFVDDVRHRYQSRIIIFDMPPLLGSDDALACLEYFDAALLVVEEGRNKAEDILQALHMLSATSLLGTVLNKAENPPEHQTY